MLPFLNSLLFRYPPSFTMISVIIELFQCLAFALNPHYPGHYVSYALIYFTQLPFWDGSFMYMNYPSFDTFLILFIMLAVVLLICIAIVVVAMVKTQFIINKVLVGLQLHHIYNFLVSLFFIPTIQVLLSGFICQRKPTLTTFERLSASYNSAIEYPAHIVFFSNEPCDTTRVTVIMGISIFLLIVWGIIAFTIMITAIPVDREDLSARRRCSSYTDIIVFVYKVGLCVTLHMGIAYNKRGVAQFVTALTSFLVAFAHGFLLPYYAHWMNRMCATAFAVIGWAACTEFIALTLDSQVFVYKGTVYIVLCIPGIVIGIIAWYLSGLRFNPLVNELLHATTEEMFVSVDKNPFVIAFLQNNFELLPFPKRLPKTDALFSPFFSTSVEILEEALREEDIMRRQAIPENGEVAGPNDPLSPKPEGNADDFVPDADIRIAEALGMDLEWNGINLIAEASRRQVVLPTLTTVWVPTDAEVCIRFLFDWQAKTETFPSPHMICFASRIFNRALLKWPKATIIYLAYIGFICDYCPSFSRISACLDLMSFITSECNNNLTETFFLFYFTIHVKMSLGIRSSFHQDMFLSTKKLHEQTLLSTTLLWRSLQEEKRNIVTLYWFASDLSQVRWKCFKAYKNALDSVVDDEVLVKNAGLFYGIVYHFKRSSVLCKMVAANLAQMQLTRLQRAFRVSDIIIDTEEEMQEEKSATKSGKNGKSSLNAEDDQQSSSRLSSASGSAASTNTSSRVSSMSSGGRSSQARSRNAKRAARLMLEKIFESTRVSVKNIEEHLHWSAFSICCFLAMVIILLIVVMNLVIFIVQFSKWEQLITTVKMLSETRLIGYLIIVVMYRIGNMLAEASFLFSSSDIVNIQGNISFFRSTINAAEASSASLFYGDKSSSVGSTLNHFTRERNFIRVYTSSKFYEEYQVSLLTQFAAVFSSARRVADFFDTFPTKSDFLNNPTVLSLTQNILFTLESSFTETEENLQISIEKFAIITALDFLVVALIIPILIGLACYLLLWNYRRAASVLASELRLFFIIPRESVKRLAQNGQKDMDTFSKVSNKSSVFSAFVYEGRKNATEASLLQSFGQQEEETSSALLARLLEKKTNFFHAGSDSRENFEEESDTSDALSKKKRVLGENIAANEEQLENGEKSGPKDDAKEGEKTRKKVGFDEAKPTPHSSPVVGNSHGGNTSAGGDKLGSKAGGEGAVTFSSAFTQDENTYLLKGKEDVASLAEPSGGKRMHENGFMLLNDFAYPDYIQDCTTTATEDENGLDEIMAAGLQLKDDADGSLTNFGWTRIVLCTALTLVFMVCGLSFLIYSDFAINNISTQMTTSYNGMHCVEKLTNTSTNMLFYSAWYIARENYDDFTYAQNAILENTEILRSCRSAINNTEYFALHEIALQNVLVALTLVVRSSLKESDVATILSYPIVIKYEWTKLLQTTTNVNYVEPYVTAEQLSEWVPYSTSQEDLLLDADDMKELGVKTFFGPIGRAFIVSLVEKSGLLTDDVIQRMATNMDTLYGHLQSYLIASICFWSLAALSSQVHLFLSSRKKPLLVILWSIFAVFSVVVAVLSGVVLYQSHRFISELQLWGNEAAEVEAKNLLFLVTIIDMLGYPLVPNDVALLNLLNVTSAKYIVSFDTPFFPQPNDVYSSVLVSPYLSMVRHKNTFFHYGWLSTVCAVHAYNKMGETSLLLNDPAISYLRWDMSTDALYASYKPLYPSDTYLSTYEEDMASNDTISICQESMVSHLLTALSDDVWHAQLSAAFQVVMRYKDIIDNTQKMIMRYFWVLFFSAGISLIAFLCVLVTLTFYSIKAFSRTDEERMLYRVTFHSDGNKVLLLCFAIFICLTVANIIGITFSISCGPSLVTGIVVLKIRWINNCLLAVGTALSSFSYYVDFMTLNSYLSSSLEQLNTWLTESYLSSNQAVKMAESRFEALFGSDKPFANYSSSIDSLFTSSCVDPTNAESGNQQPLLIQNEVIYDLMRTINTLPISISAVPGSLDTYLNQAYEAMGTVEFYFLNSSSNPLQAITNQRETCLIWCIILAVIAMILALSLYFCLLRRVVSKTRQQSIGTKVLLLGLPDDVLNTVPEIKEFYDPEAGSSDDQLKRKLLQSERLLQNILPPNISRRLKNGERVIADAHQSVTVVFASLVGFDEYSSKFDASGLVHFLNGIVVAFDHIVDLLDLEKVKTIADVYFFCGGLTKKTERDHPIRCIECSLFFFEALEDHNSRHSTPNIQLRVGINTDAAVAGVIGNKKVAYDLWGDCVNTASRMYSTGVAGRIQISDNTFQRVSNYYRFEDRHVQAKGKGTLLTHLFVERIKSTAYADLNWRVVN